MRSLSRSRCATSKDLYPYRVSRQLSPIDSTHTCGVCTSDARQVGWRKRGGIGIDAVAPHRGRRDLRCAGERRRRHDLATHLRRSARHRRHAADLPGSPAYSSAAPVMRFLALTLFLIGCGTASADGVICMVCDQTNDCTEIGPAYFCNTSDHKCTRPCQSDSDCPSPLKCDTQQTFACLCR